MKKSEPKLEKFSSLAGLAGALQAIEAKHFTTESVDKRGLQGARGAVVSAIESAFMSRYTLGKALDAYRTYFKAERDWMEAAAAIAKALQCGNRTVRNIVTDYQGVKLLPAKVINAAHSRGIDLAQRKYAPTVQTIQAMLDQATDLDDNKAEEIIDKVIQKPKCKCSTDDLFVAMTAAEKTRWKIRMKIRTALNNIKTPRKLPELIAALEEEMYVVWGEAAPITLTITPRPSRLTIDGRKRR